MDTGRIVVTLPLLSDTYLFDIFPFVFVLRSRFSYLNIDLYFLMRHQRKSVKQIFPTFLLGFLQIGVLQLGRHVITILPHGLFFVPRDLRQSVVVSIERELMIVFDYDSIVCKRFYSEQLFACSQIVYPQHAYGSRAFAGQYCIANDVLESKNRTFDLKLFV